MFLALQLPEHPSVELHLARHSTPDPSPLGYNPLRTEMAQLTDSQRRFSRAVAITVGLIAVALLALRLLGTTPLPIFIPLLLLISAIGLFLASAGRHT